jgi:gluconolactonase
VANSISRLFLCALAASVAGAQNFHEIKLDKVATGFQFTEGPAWSPASEKNPYLLFSDCVANKLHKLVPGAGVSELASVAEGPNGNTYDAQGRLYTCQYKARRVIRTSKKGVEVLAAKFEGKRLNAPNDIVVRRDGHVYFTDPAFGDQEDSRELDFFGVYHLTPKGDLQAIARWKTRPNGIAFSPNGKLLYVADSDARLVRVFDVDKAGDASHERVFVQNIEGVPDGIKVDEKGNLYVAAKHVYVYSDDGKKIGQVELGETPSNLAWGDADLESLYVTARTVVYRVRLGVKGSIQY